MRGTWGCAGGLAGRVNTARKAPACATRGGAAPAPVRPPAAAWEAVARGSDGQGRELREHGPHPQSCVVRNDFAAPGAAPFFVPQPFRHPGADGQRLGPASVEHDAHRGEASVARRTAAGVRARSRRLRYGGGVCFMPIWRGATHQTKPESAYAV